MPLILNLEYEYALFEHIRRYDWVLEPYRYENQRLLLATIEDKVIAPAEEKVMEIRKWESKGQLKFGINDKGR